MAFAISNGQVSSIELPIASAPTAVRLGQDYTADYGQIYETQGAVRTVVDAIARQVAQLGLHAFKRVDDSDRERVRDHAIATLLRAPAPNVTAYDFQFAMLADLLIYERYAALRAEDPKRGPMLIRLHPATVQPQGKAWYGGPETFKVGDKVIAADRVLWIDGYSPTPRYGGVSPIEALRQKLAEDWQSTKWREQLYRRGARLGGLLERPAAPNGARWSPEARSNFKKGWQAAYGENGSDAGGTPILEDGMKFVPTSTTPKDLEYIQARSLMREEAAAAYHVPAPMVGILDKATFSNITEQHKMMYQDTLGPWLIRVQQALLLQLSEWLSVPDDVYLEFNVFEKLRGSFEEQAANLTSALGGVPYMTQNEARARLNLPKIDGGDELRMPLNVAPTAGGSNGQPARSPDEIVKLVNAAAVLIRSGFDPKDALREVGLDPVIHLGLLPVTVQRPEEPENVDQALVDALKARLRGGSKAARGVRSKAAVDEETREAAADVLRAFFARQSAAVRSRLGAGADWWDGKRWDDELAADLLAMSTDAVVTRAAEVLQAMKVDAGEFDVDRASEYLATVAADQATSINAATRIALEEAIEADGDDDPVAAVAGVFDTAESQRSLAIGATVLAAAAGFAATEAAEQVAGDRAVYKEWVTGPNPRPSHAAMDGERVALDDVFSNGARWPGWGGIDVDELAGCNCDMVIGWDD